MSTETKEDIAAWLKKLQYSICSELELLDGKAKFTSDDWKREEGGGGLSRVICDGNVFEKGGVMFSAVHGKTPDFLISEKQHSTIERETDASTFFATGISIVIHPQNPWVPIIHMNIRYFEMSNGTKWLGGGIDLTPHYIIDEDSEFFHATLMAVCDKYNSKYYPKFKQWADEYFFIKHRKETRGIGGIFFDRLSDSEEMTFDQNLMFWKEVGETFTKVYSEIVNRNKHRSFTEDNKKWQLLRRGRYVEFNLVYDKGTKFGLETNGRIESILMSLPKLASWEYNVVPEPFSLEEDTLKRLKRG